MAVTAMMSQHTKSNDDDNDDESTDNCIHLYLEMFFTTLKHCCKFLWLISSEYDSFKMF